jgi:hypothetical protein
MIRSDTINSFFFFAVQKFETTYSCSCGGHHIIHVLYLNFLIYFFCSVWFEHLSIAVADDRIIVIPIKFSSSHY